MTNRAALVAFAKDSIARGSKSFSLASMLFDKTTRERVWLLYSWCRRCDDLSDGQDHGGKMEAVDNPVARLAVIRERTAMAFAGQPSGDPAFDSLAIVISECGLTHAMADDVIEGFALDAADWHPRSEADLYRYCYHVAGAVGIMMAVVMGVAADDEATLDRACDLGMAFQLANIARDIEEDDAAGRCYLPDEWQAKLDIGPGEHMKPHNRGRLTLMARWLCDEAEIYEGSARVGAIGLPFRSRWAVLAAAGIYGDIGRKVRAAGDHAWDHRIYVSSAEKVRRVARAGVQAWRNKPAPMARDGLWSRSDLGKARIA